MLSTNSHHLATRDGGMDQLRRCACHSLHRLHCLLFGRFPLWLVFCIDCALEKSYRSYRWALRVRDSKSVSMILPDNTTHCYSRKESRSVTLSMRWQPWCSWDNGICNSPVCALHIPRATGRRVKDPGTLLRHSLGCNVQAGCELETEKRSSGQHADLRAEEGGQSPPHAQHRPHVELRTCSGGARRRCQKKTLRAVWDGPSKKIDLLIIPRAHSKAGRWYLNCITCVHGRGPTSHV